VSKRVSKLEDELKLKMLKISEADFKESSRILLKQIPFVYELKNQGCVDC